MSPPNRFKLHILGLHKDESIKEEDEEEHMEMDNVYHITQDNNNNTSPKSLGPPPSVDEKWNRRGDDTKVVRKTSISDSFSYASTRRRSFRAVQWKDDDDDDDDAAAAASELGYEDAMSRHKQLPLPPPPLSDAELKKIMWKIDLRLIPVIMFVFFYTTLDSSALNHAKVAGMTKSLHMSDGQYHLAQVMFPITHMLFALPAMWVMERYGTRRWITLLVFLGGVFVICTGAVNQPRELIVLRTMLGCLEAGLLPGLHQTITLMYPRHFVQWRFALAATGGTLGGLLGSFIAFGLTGIHNRHIQGWRMIFIIEGAITIIAAPLTYLWMPDSVANCSYLTPTEKAQYEQVRSPDNINKGASNLSRGEAVKLFFSCLTEIKTWLVFLLMFATHLPTDTLSSNLPIMMQQGFGFTAKEAQVMGIPPKILTAVLVLLLSWYSDKLEKRLLFVVGPVTVAFVGFMASLATANGKARYGLLFLIELLGVTSPSVTMLLAQNIACDTKRGAALGIHGFITGFAHIIAAYMIWSKDAPRYIRAYLVMSSFSFLALLSCGALFLYLRRENRVKQQQLDTGTHDRKSKEELLAMGDKNPHFTYQY